ncbi:MAG: prepilin peptidase [Planctomycetota bacterium]
MSYGTYMLLFAVIQLAFVFALGACVGSLLNVLVYRLPLGLDVVRPTSRCPLCATKLTWRENVPILGWLWLRGRCRFCRGPISAEYPLVELFVATMFAGLYAWWYLTPAGWALLHSARPEWAANGIVLTWPTYVVLITLLACLVAATLIDARTFTIPATVVNVPTAVGVVGHTLHGLWIDLRHGGLERVEIGWTWTIASPGPDGWNWLGVAIGGVLGLIASWALVKAGVLRRSFEDYEAWETEAIERARAERVASGEGGGSDEDEPQDPSALWVQYPHARREMMRELLYIGPAIALALCGVWLGVWLGSPWALDAQSGSMMPGSAMPLWLQAASGSVLGYLIGGGVVWLMRIAGSLMFGKEAMGLGDVHLMAAVGACLGAIDPTVAFFVAAFVGVMVEAVRALFAGGIKQTLPYGPHLAVATVLVLVFKPWVEWGLGAMLRYGEPFPLP